MSFNKMFLISPQQLESLTQKKRSGENISDVAQHDLKEKMAHLLKHPGSAYTKSMQYNELLEKYLALLRKEEGQDREIVLKLPNKETEKIGDEPGGILRVHSQENGSPDIVEDEILDHLGQRNRKNAAFILQKLRNSDLLRWNRSGEIIVRGSPIKGSHIFDLMKTLSNRRFNSKSTPVGWNDFLKTISELNIPITTVMNTHAREQLRFKPFKPSRDPTPQVRRSMRRHGNKSMSLLDDKYSTPSTASEWRLSTPIPSKWLDFSR